MTKQEQKRLAALLLSTCVGTEYHIAPADWAHHPDTENPDLMIGSTNDYWLRDNTVSDAPFYVQRRTPARGSDYRERVDELMHRMARRIKEHFNIEVRL